MSSYQPNIKKKRKLKIAVISSTNGSVYRETCLRSEWLRQRISLLITDRACKAIDAAQLLGHAISLHQCNSSQEFSELVYKDLTEHNIDLAIIFYTKILKEPLVSSFHGRLINFHPSILPACPGLHGFEDTFKSNARIMGATVHLIGAGIDTGLPILQSHFYRDYLKPQSEVRHQLFVQQCKSLLQVMHWYESNRVCINKNSITIINSHIGDGEFTPALDSEDAQALAIPFA